MRLTRRPGRLAAALAYGGAFALAAASSAEQEAAAGPEAKPAPYDPAEPGEKKRVHRGGSFLCTDQYGIPCLVGTHGKGEVRTAGNHVGFRCLMNPNAMK